MLVHKIAVLLCISSFSQSAHAMSCCTAAAIKAAPLVVQIGETVVAPILVKQTTDALASLSRVYPALFKTYTILVHVYDDAIQLNNALHGALETSAVEVLRSFGLMSTSGVFVNSELQAIVRAATAVLSVVTKH